MALVPRWQVPMRLRIAWNVLTAVYTGLVGVLIALDRELKPETLPWVHDTRLQLSAVTVLVVVTLTDAIRRAVDRARVSGTERRRVAVRNQLNTLLVTVAENLNLSVSDLGCGLFLCRPRGVRRSERLVRTERVRIPDDLHESAVVFTKGKGAVGQCWQLGIPRHTDWIGINSKYAHDLDLVQHRWDTLSPETRRNFTVQEFIALVGKYAEVLAVPITDNGVFVGCIAIDRRWDGEGEHERCILDNASTKKLMGNVAKTLLPAMGA